MAVDEEYAGWRHGRVRVLWALHRFSWCTRSDLMAQYLPSNATDSSLSGSAAAHEVGSGEDMADLKVFWGPEICRLEYLVHLLDTGRIKDEYWRDSACDG